MSIVFKTVRFKNLFNWSVAHALANQFDYNENFTLERIGSFLFRSKSQIRIEDDVTYKRVTIRLYNKGVKLRDEEVGRNIGTKNQYVIRNGQFLMSKIDARNGAFGIATDEVDGAVITADFFAYDIDSSKINPQFLVLLTTTKQFQRFAQSASSGTTGRQRMEEKKFLDVKIPLPTLVQQNEILKQFNLKNELSEFQEREISSKENDKNDYFKSTLSITYNYASEKPLLSFVNFKLMGSWSVKDILSSKTISSNLYPIISFENDMTFVKNIFRGKSPIYDNNSEIHILNQKCIRWNKIELQYSKTVEEDWHSNIEDVLFTRLGDILINSTGEGTIGRASYIDSDFEGLLYDSHILLLRVNQEKIDPYYLTCFINSEFGQLQIDLLKSAVATKQTELGINNLKRIQFVLPPLSTQKEISFKLKQTSDEIDFLKTSSILNKTTAASVFEKIIFNS